MTPGAEFERVLDAINDCLRQRRRGELTPLCQHLLEALWHQPHLTYPKLVRHLHQCQRASVGVGHLRNEGAALWRALTLVTDVTITKRNAIDELRRWHSRWRTHDASQLVGRQGVLDRLMGQMQSDRYRVICITGMPMVGKTELTSAAVIRLRQQLAEAEAQHIHWFDARDVTTVAQLAATLGQLLHGPRYRPQPHIDPVVTLLEVLRQHPLTLILNDADVLYAPHQPAGMLMAEGDYERLLRQMVNNPTLKGRLVWVSRVCPQCLEQDRGTLCKHELVPLSEPQAVALVESHRGTPLQEAERQRLIEFCGANPGLLLATLRKVREAFGGSVEQFMANPLQIVNQDDEQWQRAIAVLGNDERVLLSWLLLRPLSYEAMMNWRGSGLSDRHRMQAIRSLGQRGFIQRQADGLFYLWPPYLRYGLADWLVHHLGPSLLENQIDRLVQYPVMCPLDVAWRCQWQRRYLIDPLVRFLSRQGPYWQRDKQLELCASLLAQLRGYRDRNGTMDPSYAIGTVLTLAAAFKLPLGSLDITGLTIRWANLEGADLSQGNFLDCQFEESLLPIHLQPPLVAAMSADGQVVVVGDGAGRLGHWRTTQPGGHLQHYYRFAALPGQSVAIRAIAVQDHDIVSLAAGSSIYRWWLGGQEPPQHLMDVEGEVRCLAQGGDHVAVGLATGQLLIKDRFHGVTFDYNLHTRPIRALTLDPSHSTLASVGFGNRVLVWDLLDSSPNSLQDDIATDRRLVLAAQWTAEGLLLGAISDRGLAVKRGDRPWVDIAAVPGLAKLTFSPNGRYLVGCDDQGILYRWDQSARALPPLSLLDVAPVTLAISNDGDRLLTVTTLPMAQVQLWDTQTGHLLWQLTEASGFPQALNLTNIQGISAAQRQHLAEFISE
jgi:WD40 repeat protein